MAQAKLKYRAIFTATTQKGISYTRIIYGRRTDDLQAQINEIGKTEKVENIKFFKLTAKNIWEQQ